MKRIFILALGLVLCAFGVGGAYVIPSANASTQSAQMSQWTHLGGDPIVKGGVHSRKAVKAMLHSQPGRNAMRAAGLRSTEAAAVANAHFKGCQLRYGMWFLAMTYGPDGTKFEGPVRFLDPSYKGHPAAAWCSTVRVGNRILKILIPAKCANFGLVSRTRVTSTPTPKPKKPKPVTTTSPGNCSAVNSPGAIVCSEIVNVCGTQVIYTGPESGLESWIDNYIQQNCPAPTPTSTVTTTVTTTTTSSPPPKTTTTTPTTTECNCSPPPPLP